MKKAFLYVFFAMMLFGVYESYSALHSTGAVLKAEEHVLTVSFQPEEEPSALPGPEIVWGLAVFAVLIHGIVAVLPLLPERLAHLTPVFYEGGYLPVFP